MIILCIGFSSVTCYAIYTDIGWDKEIRFNVVSKICKSFLSCIMIVSLVEVCVLIVATTMQTG